MENACSQLERKLRAGEISFKKTKNALNAIKICTVHKHQILQQLPITMQPSFYKNILSRPIGSKFPTDNFLEGDFTRTDLLH